MIGNPSRVEQGTTALNITASMTRRSTKTSECTSTISEMHDDVSMNVASVTMKKKYATARSMSKSMVIRTQLWSRSLQATLQTTTPTTQKGPQLSPGRSEHSSGPVVLKSAGSSPMKEE